MDKPEENAQARSFTKLHKITYTKAGGNMKMHRNPMHLSIAGYMGENFVPPNLVPPNVVPPNGLPFFVVCPFFPTDRVLLNTNECVDALTVLVARATMRGRSTVSPLKRVTAK